MARRQVSIVVSNNYSSRVFRSAMSLFAFRLLLALAVLVVALVLAALLLARAGLYRSARLSYLESRNRQLEAEFGKIAELRERLDRLEELERRYAEMLGVELAPPPVDWGTVPPESVVMPSWVAGDSWGSRPVPALLPVEKYAVSRRFDESHSGIDLATQAGTQVRASADGVVAGRGVDSVFGNFLLLEHPEGFATYYGHLQDWRVGQGDSVRSGQVIGTTGSTGRSSAPHLHFEVRRDAKRLDPAVMFRFN